MSLAARSPSRRKPLLIRGHIAIQQYTLQTEPRPIACVRATLSPARDPSAEERERERDCIALAKICCWLSDELPIEWRALVSLICPLPVCLSLLYYLCAPSEVFQIPREETEPERLPWSLPCLASRFPAVNEVGQSGCSQADRLRFARPLSPACALPCPMTGNASTSGR